MTVVVLLAAGAATRMGSSKQLLPYQGKPLVRHAAEVALAARLGPVVAVLGANSDAVADALSPTPVETVVNARWAEGMGTSICVGVTRAMELQADGVVLALADQPLITPEIFRRLVDSGVNIAASEYAGTIGVPAYFSRDLFGELLALEPAQGCKPVLLRHNAPRIPCPEAEADVDTPADFERLTR